MRAAAEWIGLALLGWLVVQAWGWWCLVAVVLAAAGGWCRGYWRGLTRGAWTRERLAEDPAFRELVAMADQATIEDRARAAAAQARARLADRRATDVLRSKPWQDAEDRARRGSGD